MITEKEAKQAANYIVDFAMPDQPITRISTDDYAEGYKLARLNAKKAGTAYLIVVVGGREVAQWRFDHWGRNYIQQSFEA